MPNCKTTCSPQDRSRAKVARKERVRAISSAVPKGLAEKALISLRDGGWLTPGALLVVEEAIAAAFNAGEGFAELERRAR